MPSSLCDCPTRIPLKAQGLKTSIINSKIKIAYSITTKILCIEHLLPRPGSQRGAPPLPDLAGLGGVTGLGLEWVCAGGGDLMQLGGEML